jgi:hypothetical protein
MLTFDNLKFKLFLDFFNLNWHINYEPFSG